MPALDESPRSPESLERLLEFERLISDLSSRFVNLPSGEVDREIEDALRRVCELLGIDFSVLWQWSSSAPGVITPTHAYPPRTGPEPPGLNTQERYPWCVQQMRAGRRILVSSLEELPPEAALDRETARLMGIRSNLTVPLGVGGEPPVGALAFRPVPRRRRRRWPTPSAG